jgi:tRNA A-37 threonylcarbamoyl transferase component Bud32
VTLEDGSHAVIKQMRRGGLLGPLWRDRFRPGRRLADNLRIPLEALRRGIPTARPVALLVLRGTAGLCRAWLAMEEIAEARDLIRRIAGSDAPTLREIDAVMRLVRTMHERGIDHRDLNLGNLLLTDRGAAPPGVFVIDLDRARLRPGPIEPAARMRALRRLERSAVKLFGETPIETFDLRRVLYESYAAGEPRWSRLGERARSANRRWIRLHRLGWALGGRPKP